MNKTLLSLFLVLIFNNYLSAQLLYSTSTPVASFVPGAGSNGTPIVIFDDVDIPSNLASNSDSISITKLRFGIYRIANAPATVVNLYYTLPDDTSDYDKFIKIPPVRIGTFNLPANGPANTAVALTLGDSISTIFKVKTNISAVYRGFQTFFVGASFNNPDEGNQILLAQGDPNDDAMWIYDIDDTRIRYVEQFGGANPPAATFYIQVYGKKQLSLPVTISVLKGERKTLQNVLSWTTETEQNNKGFELQRSVDGKNFSTIAFVSSKAVSGFSTSAIVYQYIDKIDNEEDSYYRLKQMDKDGKGTLSAVVLIKGNIGNKLSISNIYPNPAKSSLNIVLAAPATDNVNFIITDLAGKVAMQKATTVIAGSNNLSVDVSKLSPGTYVIKATCANGRETSIKKFVKL